MAKTTQDDNKQAGAVIAPRPALYEVCMGWIFTALGNTAKWIGINIGLPLLIDFINKQSSKPKFVDSAKPDDEDKKAIEKAKQDGWE